MKALVTVEIEIEVDDVVSLADVHMEMKRYCLHKSQSIRHKFNFITFGNFAVKKAKIISSKTSNNVVLNVIPGDVEISSKKGYLVKASDEVVCFYFDPVYRGYVVSSGVNAAGQPLVVLSKDGEMNDNMTTVEFVNFEGWSVHSTNGGKSVAITLVKDRDIAAEARTIRGSSSYVIDAQGPPFFPKDS